LKGDGDILRKVRHEGLRDSSEATSQRGAGNSEEGRLAKDHSMNVPFIRAHGNSQANLLLTLTDCIRNQSVQAKQG
jgi:hypothetical protein